MAMTCGSCGNKEAYRVMYSTEGEESCDRCGVSTGTFKFSDVFFKQPYFDPHIAHPENSPKGNFIRSRGHKALMMKSLGLSEVGDKRHGARDQY